MNGFREHKIAAVAWAHRACEVNGVPHLASEITIEFNSRFTCRLGDASWRRRNIRLAAKVWKTLPVMERRVAVIHEACHIIAGVKTKGKGKAHGREWVQAMHNAGVAAHVCSKVVAHKPKKRRRVKAYCGCKVHRMGATRAGRLRKGSWKYNCSLCGGAITLDKNKIQQLETLILSGPTFPGMGPGPGTIYAKILGDELSDSVDK